MEKQLPWGNGFEAVENDLMQRWLKSGKVSEVKLRPEDVAEIAMTIRNLRTELDAARNK